MNKLVRITDTFFNDLKQLVAKAIGGFRNTYTTEVYSEWGDDSRPIKEATAIRLLTEADGDEAIVGYLLKNRKAEIGEKRLYCTDENGVIKFVVWLRNDGTVLIGDSDVPSQYTNFGVKYNELLAEYNKTKAYTLALKNATQTALVALDALIPGTSAAFIAAMAGQTLGDFTQAKNEKIKTK